MDEDGAFGGMGREVQSGRSELVCPRYYVGRSRGCVGSGIKQAQAVGFLDGSFQVEGQSETSSL